SVAIKNKILAKVCLCSFVSPANTSRRMPMKPEIFLLGLAISTISAAAHAEVLPWGSNEAGPYCREYTSTVRVDGRPQQAHGVACMQPDGTWEIQSEEQSADAGPPSPPPPPVEYVPVYAPPPPVVSYHVGYGYWPRHHWHHHPHGTYVGFGYGPY